MKLDLAPSDEMPGFSPVGGGAECEVEFQVSFLVGKICEALNL